MYIENTKVWGFEYAVRGVRNYLKSEDESDSGICKGGDNGIGCENCAQFDICHHSYDKEWKLGRNDLEFMQRLLLSGSPYCRFMHQIVVSVDITAPMYWWREFDVYGAETGAGSTIGGHRLEVTPITIHSFECGEDIEVEDNRLTTHMMFYSVISYCEKLRQKYAETKDKRFWRALIQLLPESWLQTCTVTITYENLRSLYFGMHRGEQPGLPVSENGDCYMLTEWQQFYKWMWLLPYGEELIACENLQKIGKCCKIK